MPHGLINLRCKFIGADALLNDMVIDLVEDRLQAGTCLCLIGRCWFPPRTHYDPVKHLVAAERLADQRFQNMPLIVGKIGDVAGEFRFHALIMPHSPKGTIIATGRPVVSRSVRLILYDRNDRTAWAERVAVPHRVPTLSCPCWPAVRPRPIVSCETTTAQRSGKTLYTGGTIHATFSADSGSVCFAGARARLGQDTSGPIVTSTPLQSRAAAARARETDRSRAAKEFGYEGIKLSTTLASFMQRFPDALQIKDGFDKTANVVECMLTDNGPADSCTYKFCDEILYQIQISYNGKKIEQIGGANVLFDKLIQKLGTKTMKEFKLATGRCMVWGFPSVSREITCHEIQNTIEGTACVVTITAPKVEKLIQQRKEKAASLGF